MPSGISNSAAGQKYTSSAGIFPSWIAQVGDAVMINVLIEGDHVQQKCAQLNLTETMQANTDSGTGVLQLTFTVGGSFQEYRTCGPFELDRGSNAEVVYMVPNAASPSVHYGLSIDGGLALDLGEAVLGQTIG